MKRLLYALGIIAVVALVMWAGYALRYRASTPATETAPTTGEFPSATRGSGLQTGTSAGGGQSQSGTTAGGSSTSAALPSVTKFRKVSDLKIASFRALPDGSVLAFQTDGQIKKIPSGAGGKEESLSAAPIPNMMNASFSADGTKALVTTATEEGERSSVFDIALKTWQTLPAGAATPSWSPAGRIVLYAASGAGKTDIVTQDAGNAKAKPQVILSLAAQDIVPQWTTRDAIAIMGKPSARVEASAWLFDIKKKSLVNIADQARGVMGIWNASGTQALVFTARPNGTGGALSLRDSVWQNSIALSFLSLPSKCAFGAIPAKQSTVATSTAEEYLFCGIPREANAMAAAELPDAYLKQSLFTSDNLYAIKLGTGEIQLLRGEANEDFDIAHSALMGNALYFIDRFTDTLYRMAL